MSSLYPKSRRIFVSHALSVRRNSKNSSGAQPEHVTPTGQRDTPQQRTPLPAYKTGAVRDTNCTSGTGSGLNQQVVSNCKTCVSLGFTFDSPSHSIRMGCLSRQLYGSSLPAGFKLRQTFLTSNARPTMLR